MKISLAVAFVIHTSISNNWTSLKLTYVSVKPNPYYLHHLNNTVRVNTAPLKFYEAQSLLIKKTQFLSEFLPSSLSNMQFVELNRF